MLTCRPYKQNFQGRWNKQMPLYFPSISLLSALKPLDAMCKINIEDSERWGKKKDELSVSCQIVLVSGEYVHQEIAEVNS